MEYRVFYGYNKGIEIVALKEMDINNYGHYEAHLQKSDTFGGAEFYKKEKEMYDRVVVGGVYRFFTVKIRIFF